MASVKQYIDFNYYSIFVIAFYFYFLLQGLLCSHSWIARHWGSHLSLFSLSFLIFETRNNTCGASQVMQWWSIHLLIQEMQETWVRALGREDPLKEETATHSNILVWKIPWIEETGGYSLWGLKESDMTEWLSKHAIIFVNRFLVMFKWDNECSVALEP